MVDRTLPNRVLHSWNEFSFPTSALATQTDTRQSNFLYATEILALLQRPFSRRHVAPSRIVSHSFPGWHCLTTLPLHYTLNLLLYSARTYIVTVPKTTELCRPFYQYLYFVIENGTIDLTIGAFLTKMGTLILLVVLWAFIGVITVIFAIYSCLKFSVTYLTLFKFHQTKLLLEYYIPEPC